MGLQALKVVEEEFEALCHDFPYLMERVPYRKIDSTVVWNLIDQIKARLMQECVEQPEPGEAESPSLMPVEALYNPRCRYCGHFEGACTGAKLSGRPSHDFTARPRCSCPSTTPKERT